MQDFSGQKILIGVCGGIAAYKTADLIRQLKGAGAVIQVVMTASAPAFITPLTLQALSGNPVRTACIDVQAEQAMGHIELARWADYLLIAPATAHCIAKMAHGLADDLLSTLVLATRAPVIVCPAMNQAMWSHAATANNVHILKDRGVYFAGPDWGEQACGDVGFGRLTGNDEIMDTLRLLTVNKLLADCHVVITAGPTQEALDPVRYLTNKSSGKMGYALAKAARMAGARVTLIAGPTTLIRPTDVAFMAVETAASMLAAVKGALTPQCIFIGAAAVADFGPEHVDQQKIKKNDTAPYTLVLRQNPDIISAVTALGTCRYVVGFAAETDNLLANAATKRMNKKLDMIVANPVGNTRGFNTEDNEAVVLTATGEKALPRMHKTRLAGEIVTIIAHQVYTPNH